MSELNKVRITGLSAKNSSQSFPFTKPSNKNGCHVNVNITSGCNLVDKLRIQIVGLDVYGNEYLLLDGTEMTANEPFVFKLAPFEVQSVEGNLANGLSDYLPDNCLIKTVHSTASAITYSIGINFV